MATDYQKKIEQKGITEYRGYIDEQMSQAREALDAEKRSQHLANAVAANGMLLRGLAVGFVTGELNYKAIQEISRGLQNTQAFQSLMKDSGEQLAQNGTVETLVRSLQKRDRELAEAQPSRPAIEVIQGIQAKVRAGTVQPRDYATLVAAHRLSSWKGKAAAPDGKMVDVVRRDVNRRLDGRLLSEETERIMADKDFQYLMKHEPKESLGVNALRLNGAALEQYAKRANQLRAREQEKQKASDGPGLSPGTG